jgi:YgiT-type zinc finger domain-containing protein
MSARALSIRCPTCGQRALHRVLREVTTRAGRRTIKVGGVEVEECAQCGERLYDLAALRQIAAARKGRRRSTAA